MCVNHIKNFKFHDLSMTVLQIVIFHDFSRSWFFFVVFDDFPWLWEPCLRLEIRSQIITPKKAHLHLRCSENWNYHPPSNKVNNDLKIEGTKIRSKVITPKSTDLHTQGMCVCNKKTIQQMLSEISSGNWTYHLPSIKVNNGLRIKGQKNWSKVKGTSTPPKACVCVQYENNAANSSWDIVRKLNLSSTINWSE